MAIQAVWVHGSTSVARWPGGQGPEGTNEHRLNQLPYVTETGVLVGGRNEPWTDLTGQRRGVGTTFRGVRNDSNIFLFSIPTPCFRSGILSADPSARRSGRAQILRAFVLWKAPTSFEEVNGVVCQTLSVFDGPNLLGSPFTVTNPAPGGPAHDGIGIRSETLVSSALQEGVSQFTFPGGLEKAPEVFWGVGLEFFVKFEGDQGRGQNDLTFTAAGADFLVQDS